MDKRDLRWIRAEFRTRDRVTESTKEELDREIRHLNSLREQKVDKEVYTRDQVAFEALREQFTSERGKLVGQEAFVLRLQEIHGRLDRYEERLRSVVPQATYDARHDDLERRFADFDKWRANVTGRYVGFAVLGAIFVSTVSGVIVHLTSG